MVKLELVNDLQIKHALDLMTKELSDKVMLNINTVAAKIAQDEIKKAVPSGNNDKKSNRKLENNIRVKRLNGYRTAVGVSPTRNVFWARFIEKGTGARSTKGKGKRRPYRNANRGKVTGKHYLEDAHARAYPRIIEYMNKNVYKIMTRSLRRISKRRK